MINLSYFIEKYKCESSDDVFNLLKSTIRTYYNRQYYVDWQKVVLNVRRYESDFVLLSTVCGCEDIQLAAQELIRENPRVIRVLPILMAVRDQVNLIDENTPDITISYDFDEYDAGLQYQLPFTDSLLVAERNLSWSDSLADRYADFIVRSGIVHVLQQIRSVPDYVLGVEVGMDTNSRKNRSGAVAAKAFRSIYIRLQETYEDLIVESEVTSARLKQLGVCVPSDYADVKWDYVFFRRGDSGNVILVELNHYGTHGSKPSEISRSYKERYRTLRRSGIQFLWVTDGAGWFEMLDSLLDAFTNIANLTTIKLADDGYLEYIVKRYLFTDSAMRDKLA